MRVAWVVGAVLLVAFAAFEMVAHPGWTLVLGVVGAVAPDAPRLLGARARETGRARLTRAAAAGYDLVHWWVPPALLLVGLSLVPVTNDQVAPAFTLALTWLAHICVSRARSR